MSLILALAVGTVFVIQERPSNSAPADSPTRRFSNIRYLGGAPEAQVRIFAWENTLTINRSAIRLSLLNGVAIVIAPARVTALTYAGVKHKLRWDEKLTAVVAFPVGAAEVLAESKRKEHFLTIDYTLPDGRETGILLQLHKDNFAQVVEALREALKPDKSTDP